MRGLINLFRKRPVDPEHEKAVTRVLAKTNMGYTTDADKFESWLRKMSLNTLEMIDKYDQSSVFHMAYLDESFLRSCLRVDRDQNDPRYPLNVVSQALKRVIDNHGLPEDLNATDSDTIAKVAAACLFLSSIIYYRHRDQPDMLFAPSSELTSLVMDHPNEAETMLAFIAERCHEDPFKVDVEALAAYLNNPAPAIRAGSL